MAGSSVVSLIHTVIIGRSAGRSHDPTTATQQFVQGGQLRRRPALGTMNITRSPLVLVMTLCLSSCAMAKYRRAAEQCVQLAPGTTESQVLAIMGPPEARGHPRSDRDTLWLWYSVGGDLAPIVVTLSKVGETYVTIKQSGCAAARGD